MTTERKAWGSTTLLQHDQASQLSRIVVVRGGYSSRHYHTSKANVFAVVRGKLTITTYKQIGDSLELHRVLECGPGGNVSIGPGIIHRFYANSDTECFELYFAPYGGEVRLNDIIRFDTNGVDPAAKQASETEVADDQDDGAAAG